jgi:hypothetical protein
VTADYRKVGPPNPPPPTTLGPVAVSVAPADSFTVVSGLNTPVSNNASVQIVFQVKSGGNNVGAYISGTAQERITDITFLGVAQPDGNWTPPVPAQEFFMAQGKIYDTKNASLAPGDWANLQVGEVFWTGTQHMRIVWADCLGQIFQQPLGSIKLQRRKVSATAWQMELQP